MSAKMIAVAAINDQVGASSNIHMTAPTGTAPATVVNRRATVIRANRSSGLSGFSNCIVDPP
jgi:hypothetical protein